MQSRNKLLSASIALLIASANTAGAADIPVDARIDAVKVYGQGASIVRRSQVSVPSGTHRLVFKELPANIDTDTLRISVASREVRLGGIEVERVANKEFVSVQERELRNRLQTLIDQRSVIQDDIATADTQLKLIDSLATTPAGGTAKAAVDATNLSAVLNTMSSSSSAARGKVRDAKIRQRELEKDIEKTNADLQKIATARKDSLEVRAFIDAASAVSPTVAIEYSTNDAQWRWVYEARLDTGTKRVSLGRHASVEQSTGEDWQNASLTLTTAQPSQNAMTPQVASLFLDLQHEEEADLRRDRYSMRPASSAPSVEEVVVTGSNVRANVVSTEYLADYQIPGRVTLDSDGEPRLYPIGEEAMDVDLTARVIPSASRSAYLEALFTFKGDVPMQGGEVQLYRDGAFVGLAQMGSLLPGAEARIPFGIDERIRVIVRDEPKQSGDQGIVSKHRVNEHKQRFEVTNYHAVPITVEIIDRVPVPENKDVRVDVLKGATAPTEENVDGKAGVMLWRMSTQPRQSATVNHYYSVRYPADRELSSRVNDE
jgi:uncharacterized protein (TIGR02231 family)